MDRMLYLSMSAASNVMTAQAVNSHNLANVNTTGFKADLSQFRSMPVFGEVHPSRVYALEERPGIDLAQGTLQHTGRDLDIAVNGNGWIVVQADDGTEAMTRAGDLRVSSTGLLENGAGRLVLGDGGPISMPPYTKIDIGSDGTITIRPTGQDEKTLATIGRIKLVSPPVEDLVKGQDGLFRLRDGSQPQPDASVLLTVGALESSNVNTVQALVKMIELSRKFEMHMKAMSTVQQNDEVATSMLNMN
jgi:flagellar basal-body rod protein FlgF